MKNLSLANYSKYIRQFFKELILKHNSEGYKEKIVAVNSKNEIPTFQLRFIKQGEECKYYRVIVKDTDYK